MAAEVIALARLDVPRDELLLELRRMVKVLGRKAPGQALLRFRDGELSLRIGGAEFAVTAQGRWPGEARVTALWIRTFAKMPPAQDPVIFQVSQGRLRIASSSFPCSWQPTGAATLEVPLDVGLPELLRLAATHDEETLERSGVARAVAEARADLEKRIAAASRPLSVLGITPADLRVLIIGKLQSH